MRVWAAAVLFVSACGNGDPSSAPATAPVACSDELIGGEPCTAGATCDVTCVGGVGRSFTGRCEAGVWRLTPAPCADPFDTGPPPPDRTTGKACQLDEECDVSRTSNNFCSVGGFNGNSIFPTNVCVGYFCDPSQPLCDDGKGVCLRSEPSRGLCLPRCSFDDSGAAPVGCIGKNACHPHAYLPADNGIPGLGYCLGGCSSDADCKGAAANACQRETGHCVAAKGVPSAPLGAPCSVTGPEVCNCYHRRETGKGYCSHFCRAGLDACPAGFACDIGVSTELLSKIPVGLAGTCLKECTTDDDCSGMNAQCTPSVGLPMKTCKPG